MANYSVERHDVLPTRMQSNNAGEDAILLGEPTERDSLIVKSDVRDLVRSEDGRSGSYNHWLCCIPLHWIQSYEYDSDRNKNNYLSTVVLLLNSMVGSGIIVQAFVFKMSGVLGATIMYIMIGCLTYVGAEALFQVAHREGIYDYNILTRKALGSTGDLLLNLFIAIGNLGSSLSYIFLIGSLSMNVIEEFSGALPVHEKRVLKVLISFLSVCVIVPTCLIRNFGRFSYISYISMAAISGIILLIAVTGLFTFLSLTNVVGSGAVLTISTGGMLRSSGSVVFAFGFANALFHSYAAMQEPPRAEQRLEHFTKLLQRVTTVGVVACYMTGFIGYLTFRDNTQSDILVNYTGYISVLFKVPFIIHLILYIPGEFVIMRYSIFRLLDWDVRTSSQTAYVGSTVAIIAMLGLISCLLQFFASDNSALAYILSITGAVAGSAINYILPGLIAYYLQPPGVKRDYYTELQVYSLCVFGFFLPFMTLGSMLVHAGLQ